MRICVRLKGNRKFVNKGWLFVHSKNSFEMVSKLMLFLMIIFFLCFGRVRTIFVTYERLFLFSHLEIVWINLLIC